MGGLETLLPTGGVAAVLVAVIAYLLRANTVDRKDYRDAIEAWQKRWEDCVAAYRDIQSRLDGERDLRRKAEDATAVVTAQRNTEEIAQLREQIQLLRQQVKR